MRSIRLTGSRLIYQLLPLMLLTLSVVSGSARDFSYAFEDQTINYTVLDEEKKTVAVSGSNNISGCLVLPAHPYDGNTGYTLTEISEDAFKDGSYITSVTIPESVTAIGNNAFYNCSKLNSINIPETVTKIGEEAFCLCIELTAINIPGSVTSIGKSAFAYCTSLYSIALPTSITAIEDYTFHNCKSMESISIPGSVTVIGDKAFYNCSALEYVDIPESIVYIGNDAFNQDFNIKKVDFKSIESICRINFANHYSNPAAFGTPYVNGVKISELVIPKSVTSIGNYAFVGFVSVNSVYIPASVKEIGTNAFSSCRELKHAEFESIESLCEINFANEFSNPLYFCHNLIINGVEVKDVVIPESVSGIGQYAFYDCTGISSVSIPNSVTSIGASAFNNCTGLTSVDIPDSVKEIGQSAFYNCSGLTSVNIPRYLTKIEYGTFYNCTSLASVEIPNSITEIGGYAFFDCLGMTSVTVPPSVRTIGESAFSMHYPATATDNTPRLKTVAIGYGIKEIGDYAFPSSVENIYMTARNYPSVAGNSFRNYNATLWLINEDAAESYKNAPDFWNRYSDIRIMECIDKISSPELNFTGEPGDSFTPEVTIQPENATLKNLFWSTNRPDIISVNNDGVITILPTSGNAGGSRAAENCKVTVSTMFKDVAPLEFTINAYPSGVKDLLNDGSGNSADHPNDIYSLQGICLKRNASADDIKALTPGLYIIAGKKVLVK